jgi:hypothetical protein
MGVPIIKVYDRLNTTLVATLSPSTTSGVIDAVVQRQISRITPGSVTIPIDHPQASSLVFGNVVRCYDSDETFLGAFVVHEVERDEVANEEAAAEVITASGESPLSILKRALVRGWVADPEVEPQSDVKAFEVFSPKFDRTSAMSTTLVEVDRSLSELPLPQGWPDPFGLPVWAEATSGSNTHPVSLVQAIRDFDLDEDAEVIFYATADDRFRLLIDGIDLISAQAEYPADAWYFTYRVGAVLPAGEHRLGIEARNDAASGPGAFWVSAWKRGLVAQDGGAILFTADSPSANEFIGTWRRDYYTGALVSAEFRNGFTALNILRILVEEAQDDGALPGVEMGWDFGDNKWASLDAEDSAGNTDTILPGFTAKIDSSVWDAVEALCEDRLEVDISGESGFELRAWVKRDYPGMGTNSTDEIVEGENLMSITRISGG